MAHFFLPSFISFFSHIVLFCFQYEVTQGENLDKLLKEEAFRLTPESREEWEVRLEGQSIHTAFLHACGVPSLPWDPWAAVNQCEMQGIQIGMYCIFWIAR